MSAPYENYSQAIKRVQNRARKGIYFELLIKDFLRNDHIYLYGLIKTGQNYKVLIPGLSA